VRAGEQRVGMPLRAGDVGVLPFSPVFCRLFSHSLISGNNYRAARRGRATRASRWSIHSELHYNYTGLYHRNGTCRGSALSSARIIYYTPRASVSCAPPQTAAAHRPLPTHHPHYRHACGGALSPCHM